MSLQLARVTLHEQLELQFEDSPWNCHSPRYLTKIHLSGKLPKPRGNEDICPGARVDPHQLELRL